MGSSQPAQNTGTSLSVTCLSTNTALAPGGLLLAAVGADRPFSRCALTLQVLEKNRRVDRRALNLRRQPQAQGLGTSAIIIVPCYLSRALHGGDCGVCVTRMGSLWLVLIERTPVSGGFERCSVVRIR